MEERNYGAVFRTLRKSKGYTLRQVTEGITTHSYLSKFERGECECNVKHFFAFLERLNTSWVEYANYFEKSDSDAHALMVKIDHHARHGNIDKLVEMAEREEALFYRYDEKAHRLAMLMIQGSITSLDSTYEIEAEHIEFLEDFLMADESWGIFELRLFAVMCERIRFEMALSFVREIFNKMDNFLKQDDELLVETKRIMTTAVQNMVVFSLNHGHFELAKNLLAQIDEKLIHPTMFRGRTLQLFYSGMAEVKLGNKAQGIELANKAFDVLDVMDPNLSAAYKNYFNNEVLAH
jgi:Rgg/GadR/MutR family transcriptional activator